MKTLKITITGAKQNTGGENVTRHPDLKLAASIQVSGAMRGATKREEIELTPNHLVELVFDDNTRWMCPPNTLEDVYPGNVVINRDGSAYMELPTEIDNEHASRGLFGKVALKVLNVFVKKKITGDIDKNIKRLAQILEEKQIGKLRGLVNVTSDFTLLPTKNLNAANPFLLFLHGTNSSTHGSFEELKGSGLWEYIQQTYGGNVLAFEHETLTKSPLQNAVELITALPDKSTLHIISHSRGGLIGEILCRCSNESGNEVGFTQEEISYLEEEKRESDVECIKEILKICRKKSFRVNKFIRVACPSAGTTVLSKRLDHFFNISLNLLGVVPALAASPVYAAMKDLLLAVVDSKNDVGVLSGLEAMKPESPFITLINNQKSNVSIGEPVLAISGNCKVKLNLKALCIIASKLFFMDDNDLVVNTSSMYAGSKRKDKLQYFFDEGTDVDHFHYFENKKTNEAIRLALKAKSNAVVDGFTEFSRGTVGEAERNALLKLDGGQYSTGDPSGNKPIVVLLPGIMGSALEIDGNLFWINYLRFITGGLSNLDVDTSDVSSTALIKSSYKKLGDELQGDYDVVTFPFDWRLSMERAAEKLNEKIGELLELNQPIKIVGHSMGGVLVRDFMVYHPDRWKELNESKDFRLLFLGSPLGGSYRINNVLFGEDDMINKLAKIDLAHSKKKLLEMFSNFPGILSLLPLTTDTDNDFSKLSVWKKMANAFGDDDWPIPGKDTLADFGKYREKISTLSDDNFKNAVYIAGQDKQTPCGYRIDETSTGKQLVFLSTAEGDQSVTWESGIPKKMIENKTVYYASCSHGALSNTPSIFGAIKEILASGKTSMLTSTRPVVRGGSKPFKKPATIDLDISQEGLENSILGISKEEKISSSELPVKVKISHGDLKYATYPLLAGHFKNDGILYAEARIDGLLNGVLNEQHKLGIYPGDIGTYELMLNNNEGFPGAIIIGMGEPDKLTAYELSRSVEQGLVKYLVAVNGKGKVNTQIRLKEITGISSLAMACGYGGLSVEGSVSAVLQAVANANAKIGGMYKEKARIIELVEFVELYEDRALSCYYAVRRLSREMGGSMNITMESKRIAPLNGSRKQLSLDQGNDWWNRITISKEKGKKRLGEEHSIKGMKFSISTGAAREELRTIFTNTGVLDQLIEEISTDNNWTEEKAKALFELLLPNDFKARLKKHGNITWVVDKYTACFPWELLQDKNKDSKPLCIKAGMIRQMATADSRLNIEQVSGSTALVIGDPDLGGTFTQLPGALAEAKAVAKILNEEGFETKSLLSEQAGTIIPAMMGDYKIIHLAGHGIFDTDPGKPSGMVIGPNSYMTTAEIAQMGTTPELVFVNCCFLGKTNGVAEKYFQSRYKLAANIGTQLIDNGVKAVVVAGWAVDDAAALAFAKRFYKSMFEGKCFGDAVKEAREDIYESFKEKNTWGAYQCYGDPFYKLRNNRAKTGKKNYVIAEQAIIDLDNLLSDMKTGEPDEAWTLEKLNEILDEVNKQGLCNNGIIERECFIYLEANLREMAISRFEYLFASPSASYSFIAVEKYCNVKCKHVLQQFKDGEKGINYKSEFNKVIVKLNSLLSLSPTPERYSLLASAYKRKIVTAGAKEQGVEMIRLAAENYYKAFNHSEDKDGYSYINFIVMQCILIICKKIKWKTGTENTGRYSEYTLKQTKDRLNDMERVYLKKQHSTDYWDKIIIANIRFCELMINATIKKEGDKILNTQTVINEYKKVWAMAGSKNEKSTELDNLDLLIEGLKRGSQNHFSIKLLEKIVEGFKAVK